MENKKKDAAKKPGNLNAILRKLLQNPKKIIKRYVKKDMTVLDIGCGPGLFSFEMAKIGAKVIAADLQQEMLDRLENKIKGLKIEKRIKLIKCDENNINIPDKADFALAFYVLNEVTDKEAFLGQIKKALKQGAMLLIAEPAKQVNEEEFKSMIEIAEKIGFKNVDNPKISLSRTALLKA